MLRLCFLGTASPSPLLYFDLNLPGPEENIHTQPRAILLVSALFQYPPPAPPYSVTRLCLCHQTLVLYLTCAVYLSLKPCLSIWSPARIISGPSGSASISISPPSMPYKRPHTLLPPSVHLSIHLASSPHPLFLRCHPYSSIHTLNTYRTRTRSYTQHTHTPLPVVHLFCDCMMI